MLVSSAVRGISAAEGAVYAGCIAQGCFARMHLSPDNPSAFESVDSKEIHRSNSNPHRQAGQQLLGVVAWETALEKALLSYIYSKKMQIRLNET